MTPRPRFVRVDGVPLHVLVEGPRAAAPGGSGGPGGPGGPPVVLSAGLAMAWFDWDPVAAELVARGRTVIRFDRPGHGLSAPAAEPPGAAAEAHRIAALLDALAVPGPVTVVGHSLAGFHAEAFARLHPGRTAALLLLDSSVEESPRTLLPAALRTGAARALGRAVSAVGLPAALGPAAREAAVRAGRAGRAADPAARDLVRRCYRTGRVWRGALLENARYPDMAAEVLALAARYPLSAPVTVLAAHDGGSARAARRWLDRQAALSERLGARFEVAAPAGHLVMLDRPHQVARAVLEAD
ncbi:alpha/beta hydrolase [Streptomyces sp. RerS4]|uniref:alpha/beta fold hydrolase n=1 Tax=Streptomyces sp. RerS4 TaxID=2942449 RepID=UPI00201C69A1|nr:alpha/beta hydrolase [Streptomyces sp. RerS4]UQX00920.1 alpha/beta hydrolase [Streptomyces sp. RerS4]